MRETALVALATFFATVGPLDIAVLFAGLTNAHRPRERRAMAIRGVAVASGILLFFALFGKPVLAAFGISLPALRTAGGILLLLIAVDLVFARSSGGTTTTSDEVAEAERKRDIAVFPLAMPLIAGPGAIGAAILLVAQAQGDPARIAAVLGALLAIMLLTLVLLLTATQVQKLIGVTALHVVSRVAGILLAALAVQFVFDGIGASGLLSGGAG